MSPDEIATADQQTDDSRNKLGVPTTLNSTHPSDFNNIKPFNFRIYSHNVKNAGNHDLVPGELDWTERLVPLTASMRFNTMAENSIITLQEVYAFQMQDILTRLNHQEPDKWTYYARGRIDGDEMGEFVPILWQDLEWELVYSDTMWLNEQDPRSSLQGWDAVYSRIVSFVTLRHRKTKNYINVFNSHFDHIGVEAQIGSAELILKKMSELNKWPSFLCGDLNFEPNLEPYKKLTKQLVSSSELDGYKHGHSHSSVTGFKGEVLLDGGQNIDYIFAPKYANTNDAESTGDLEPKNVDLRLYQFGMLHSKFNGRYMSDHRPIVADYIVRGTRQ
ncbi:hypothetical protein Cantr_05843 [Candida viswanathii]|uniref:Uncharacterized protein n=1 Tax=Candida viswanathii TaxID=5486 RepID=A0A367XTA5_9ASCO|nr:hypothetical protein Cantr_05843 [Candida viswanathii]